MKLFNESAEKIKESMILLKRRCESCGKLVKQYQSNYDRPYKFIFINITQEPAKHYFCSKKCKIEWIFNTNKHQILNLKTPIY